MEAEWSGMVGCKSSDKISWQIEALPVVLQFQMAPN